MCTPSGDPFFHRLVEAALAGDPRAQRSLHARLDGPIHRALTRLHRDAAAQADDLAQVTWLRLWSRRGHCLRAYDHRRGVSPERYAEMIARSVARGAARKRTEVLVDDLGSLTPLDPGPEDQVIARDLVARTVAHLTATLSPRDLRIFAETFAGDGNASETSALVGSSVQTIANVRFRVRSRVRKFLAAA